MVLGKIVAIAALLPLGGALVWYGWTIVDNIWGSGDSPSWAYVMFGLPLIVAGICCLAAVVYVMRRRDGHGSG